MVQSGLDATKRGVHDINVTIQARQSLIVSLCELDHLLHRVILSGNEVVSVVHTLEIREPRTLWEEHLGTCTRYVALRKTGRARHLVVKTKSATWTFWI